MPTYDYICDNCQYETEMFQSFTEDVKRDCPKCNKLKFRRIISGGAGIVFKGSGFYVTDSRASQTSNKKQSVTNTTTENTASTTTAATTKETKSSTSSEK